MGYNTQYNLTIAPADPQAVVNNDLYKYAIIADLRATYADAATALTRDGSKNEPIHWYDHEDELVEFSKQYPEVVFTLSGEGEDAGDVWKKYFNNGKKQIDCAVMTIADYDETLLT